MHSRPALHLAFFALWMLAPLAPLAQAKANTPEGLVMHRVQAGQPNASGWYDANSTEGRFSVQTPIPFNDFTVKSKSGDEPPAYVIGSKSAEGFKFSATRVAKPVGDAKAEIDTYLKNMRSTSGATLSGARTFAYQGRPAVEFKIEGKAGTAAFMRQVVLTDGMVLLVVEYPVEKEAQIAPLVPKFFNSLRLE